MQYGGDLVWEVLVGKLTVICSSITGLTAAAAAATTTTTTRLAHPRAPGPEMGLKPLCHGVLLCLRKNGIQRFGDN